MGASKLYDIAEHLEISDSLDATYAWLTLLSMRNWGSFLNVTIFSTKSVLIFGLQLIHAAQIVWGLTLIKILILEPKKAPWEFLEQTLE
jgi:hypothetical protein